MRSVSAVRAALLVVVLALALVAAGCGSKKSSDTSSATDWANGVCTAITTWGNSIKSTATSLQGGNISKGSLQSAADDMTSATDTLQSDLNGLGKPDTTAGPQAKSALDDLTAQLKTDSDTIKSAVKDVSGLSGAVTAATTVSTTLVTMGTQISTAFTNLQKIDAKGELQTAFKQADSCKKLANSN